MSRHVIEASWLLPGPPGQTRHYWGAPSELGEGQRPMADPAVVSLEQSEAGWFLIRLTEAGEFAGDTWHLTREDALDQAAFEYGDRLGGWTPMTDGTTAFEEIVSQLPHRGSRDIERR